LKAVDCKEQEILLNKSLEVESNVKKVVPNEK